MEPTGRYTMGMGEYPSPPSTITQRQRSTVLLESVHADDADGALSDGSDNQHFDTTEDRTVVEEASQVQLSRDDLQVKSGFYEKWLYAREADIHWLKHDLLHARKDLGDKETEVSNIKEVHEKALVEAQESSLKHTKQLVEQHVRALKEGDTKLKAALQEKDKKHESHLAHTEQLLE
jgi:hypothetical protein